MQYNFDENELSLLNKFVTEIESKFNDTAKYYQINEQLRNDSQFN